MDSAACGQLGYDARVRRPIFPYRERLSRLFAQVREHERGWTAKEAEVPGRLSNTSIANVESPSGNPTIRTLTTYAERLGYELEDMLAAATHPESEDAFGHPDVQKFIRVWKRLNAKQREELMSVVEDAEALARPLKAMPGASEGGTDQ